MISDDLYDIALAFIAIVVLSVLHFVQAPGWLQGTVLLAFVLLVVSKDHLTHDRRLRRIRH